MIDLRSAMTAEAWAMDPRAFEALARTVSAAVEPEAFMPGKPAAPASYAVRDGVAEIGLRGVLLRGRTDPMLARWGVPHTGYEDIREQALAAASDPAVKAIVLAVDSPGGMASGVARAADGIAEARRSKPVTARVESMAASAAYWLAAQAKTIEAESDAIVGSIGVYSTVADFSRAIENEGIRVHVLRSGPHKGTGTFGAPVTTEQLAPLQAVVDDLAESFVSAVAAGRNVTRERAQEWASGAAWVAPRAKQMGLVDTVGRASAAPTSPRQEVRMSTQEPAPAAEKSASLAELRAEFGARPSFVLDQFEAKATLEQARTAHLKIERDELAAEVAALKAAKAAPAPAQPKKASGPAPVPSGPAADSGEPEDFVARARAYAAAKGVSMKAAMSAVAKADPNAHADWVASIPPVKKKSRR